MRGRGMGRWGVEEEVDEGEREGEGRGWDVEE